MKRAHVVSVIFVLLWSCVVRVDAAKPQAADNARPNIVFLFTDDQVDLSVGCYGNAQVKTPHMDQLGADGVIFTNHYNTTAICMASRAIVMTGLYEYRAGCNFMHGPMLEKTWAKSYPMLLREAGYFTGIAGKFGFDIVEKTPDRFGHGTLSDERGEKYFDIWAGGQGQTSYDTDAKNNHPRLRKHAEKYPHASRAYAAWADDFITAAQQSGKPFCLSISFKAPHLPFTPDPAFDDVYANSTYRQPANYGVKNATHLAWQSKTGRQFKSYRFWVNDYQESIRNYNQLIHGVDAAIGMIRKSLAAHGVADNTVIIFTSDNGYSCGAHGFGGKVLPYEEASRSPLIIVDPRRPAAQRGKRRDVVTGNIDMMPTILDLAGVDIPQGIDGLSLVPLLGDRDTLGRDSIALLNMWGNPQIHAMAIVSRDYKYIFWHYETDEQGSSDELFHLAKDRLEMTNVVGDSAHADALKTMRRRYDRQVKHIKVHAVDYHDYRKYGVLFDRSATPEQKTRLWRRR